MNELKTRIEHEIQRQSYACLLGLKVEEAEEGRVVISCEKRRDLLQQTGILHGGVIGGLCEATAGYAIQTMMPDGKDLVGVEYKISLMRALAADTVLAAGKVIKMGKQLVVADVEAYNKGSDKICAKMIFTGMLIDKER
ncbi:MAG: PaaI family thioesterase [Ruminiclostridium sp.]|nr:PaaI family thioesterase [Ruminiclostridium sp.]